MERVILRHITGSKASQVDTYPLDQFTSVVIGRDPSATLRYDPTRDDLVGRLHARIERDSADPYRFLLTDLDSRNGTFLNRQRIVGTAALTPGDVVQFGPGGPELEFQIDPLPPGLVNKTRLAVAAVEPTRVAPAAAPVPRAAVGAATVQRMVVDVERRTSRRSLAATAIAASVIVVLVGVVAVSNLARWKKTDAKIETLKPATVTPAEVADQFAEATVFIEMGWKLFDTESGSQIYQEYLAPKKQGEQPIALYVRLADGTVEPALTDDRGENNVNRPVGYNARGSGFVVTSDGFILTNRHVAAPWETAYTSLEPGLLVDLQTRKVEKLDRPPTRWVPAASHALGRRPLVGKNLEGRHDYLDVTFARNRLRVPAKLVRVSDHHDVSLVKVDLPQAVKKVELFDNYDSIRPGMSGVIMGYPAVSPEVVVASKSLDPFSREAQARVVPDPTITPTTVGRVLRGSQKMTDGADSEYFSELGDSYQLTNAPGGGNSGGPLFDDHGRVIGLYYAGKVDARGSVIGFAVPIKYGLELMRVSAVVK